jgi:AAA+ ATPase superfamily predicted ATPase
MGENMKQSYGNWVDGDRFWNREKDIELLVERINSGQHVLLVAQRRMGKTSVMREIARRLNKDYICLLLTSRNANPLRMRLLN